MTDITNGSKGQSPTERSLFALRALHQPRGARMLAWWLMGIVAFIGVAVFLPWQQNVRGRGQVTALSPANRPQTVETVIAGRIQRWHIREGQRVKKGDTILSLSEVREKYFDPQLLRRLGEQIEAKSGALRSKDQKAAALQSQISFLGQALLLRVKQAEAKRDAEKIRFQNLESLYLRNRLLLDSGNITLTKYQEIEYKYTASQADYLNAIAEVDGVRTEYLDKISKGQSDLNQTRAEQFEAEADLAKLRNEFSNMEIRNRQYQITAPQDGIVVRASKAGIGETLKEGDAACTILPTSNDVAVEMYLRAMDVPLVSRGRKVRIQFDGWPSLQFSGWPSVSIGTFGGIVEVIDFVNSAPGEFRILVIPDPHEESWPAQIKIGSGTRGWVMLDNVRVWYEIWRQLNGFPPSLYRSPEEKKSAEEDTKEIK